MAQELRGAGAIPRGPHGLKAVIYQDDELIHFEVWVDGGLTWDRHVAAEAVDDLIDAYLEMKRQASMRVGPFFAGRVVKRRLFGTVKRARLKAARKRRKP